MYKVFALALTGLMAIPLTLGAVATKSCKCYTATTTVTPEVCAFCVNPTPLDCLVEPTITTTIPGPNPTCSTTSTITATSDCPCFASECPTAWATKTGAFTCKRGGTKETGIGNQPASAVDGEEAEGPVITDASILPIDGSITTGLFTPEPMPTDTM